MKRGTISDDIWSNKRNKIRKEREEKEVEHVDPKLSMHCPTVNELGEEKKGERTSRFCPNRDKCIIIINNT